MEYLKQLAREIHRRSLWQVLGTYLGASWLVYEVVGAIVEQGGLPDWVPAAALVLLLTGLPIVLATAFVQEGIGSGDRTSSRQAGGRGASPVAGSEEDAEAARGSGVARLLTWRNALFAGVLIVAFWGVAVTGSLLLSGEAGGDSPPSGAPLSVEAHDPSAPSGLVLLSTEPPEAAVTAVRVDRSDPATPALDDTAIPLGSSPVRTSLAEGEYLFTVAASGMGPVTFIDSVGPAAPVQRSVRLMAALPVNESMVPVSTGLLAFDADGVPEEAFLLDRLEVTNEAFARFVSDGGYEDPRFWPSTLDLAETSVPGDEAARHLVDRTGMAGPRDWSGGVYPMGAADLPVVEVTWYEAAAHCAWAGKRLPSWRQWWRGALGDSDRTYPWGDDVTGLNARANFGNRRVSPAGSFPLGVSPFGTLDQAGNVQEWVDRAGSAGDQAETAGGAWNDPIYTFSPEWRESFPLWFHNPTLGFRCARDAR